MCIELLLRLLAGFAGGGEAVGLLIGFDGLLGALAEFAVRPLGVVAQRDQRLLQLQTCRAAGAKLQSGGSGQTGQGSGQKNAGQQRGAKTPVSPN